MALSPGTQLGPYAITGPLGAGGMGEVYRATDTKLGRQVAIKVLPETVAADPERAARFDREAKTLAALNHPNIAAIYGLEDADGVKALVMELVEGPTLADRIAQGPIPVDEALPIAKQIAEALEAAHELGIIHRDLKPANVKVRPDGTVKVLDFGLAKAMEPAGAANAGVTATPTVTSPTPMTGAGVILGTAAYMSPEQARGKPVDKRTDIWAFGCVLYEMLTGTAAFDGDDMASVLGLSRLEPQWQRLPRASPLAIATVLKRCLQKDPARRTRDVADVRFELEEAFAAPAASLESRAVSHRHGVYAGWIVAAGVSVAAAAVVALSFGRTPSESPESRLQIVTSRSAFPASIAISPDGRTVVFEAEGQLWLRALETVEARPLTGTGNGTLPFWSPDGRSVAFFADALLKRIDLASGFVRPLAPAPQGRRGTWNSNAVIVFGPASVGPLHRVPAEGGAVTDATTLLPGQTNHRWPAFLPDGQRFLYFVLGAADVRGVYLGSLIDLTPRRVSDRESAYAFMAPDYLLFARQGALWARTVDREWTGVVGGFIPIAPKVLVSPEASGLGAVSASSVGSLAYRESGPTRQLMWVDRSGRTVATVGQPDDADLGLRDLSSDGRTIAVLRTVDGNPDVWLVDAERGVSRRLTFAPGDDGEAVFSPDGSRVAYAADGRDDVYQMAERRADGTGSETLLFDSGENKNLTDWSPDGRYILYVSQSSTTNFDLWALPLTGNRTPVEVVRTPFAEIRGTFSPDGRWIAYSSNESGRFEVLLRPFPGPGPAMQVSVGGGSSARWASNGRELFYLAPDNRLMTVPVEQRGSALAAGSPRALFRLSSPSYAPSPDGERFLVTATVAEASPITVILNWKPPGE